MPGAVVGVLAIVIFSKRLSDESIVAVALKTSFVVLISVLVNLGVNLAK